MPEGLGAPSEVREDWPVAGDDPGAEEGEEPAGTPSPEEPGPWDTDGLPWEPEDGVPPEVCGTGWLGGGCCCRLLSVVMHPASASEPMTSKAVLRCKNICAATSSGMPVEQTIPTRPVFQNLWSLVR